MASAVNNPVVTPNTGVTQSVAPPATGKSALGRDEFVKLLLTQLANQDPTSPQSNEQFIAQLAQFTSVEAMTTVNQNLETLILAQTAANQTASANLAGRTVMYNADKIHLDGNTNDEVNMRIRLDSNASSVTVNVKDENGKVVRTMQLGPQQKGDIDATFENVEPPLPEGNYSFEVKALNDQGKAVETELHFVDTIDSISFANGFAEMLINGNRLSMSAIVEVIGDDSETNPVTGSTSGNGANGANGGNGSVGTTTRSASEIDPDAARDIFELLHSAITQRGQTAYENQRSGL